MNSQHTEAHTFASRTSQNSDQSLQKSVFFADPGRNSIYFSPTLLSVNFFAIVSTPKKQTVEK